MSTDDVVTCEPRAASHSRHDPPLFHTPVSVIFFTRPEAIRRTHPTSKWTVSPVSPLSWTPRHRSQASSMDQGSSNGDSNATQPLNPDEDDGPMYNSHVHTEYGVALKSQESRLQESRDVNLSVRSTGNCAVGLAPGIAPGGNGTPWIAPRTTGQGKLIILCTTPSPLPLCRLLPLVDFSFLSPSSAHFHIPRPFHRLDSSNPPITRQELVTNTSLFVDNSDSGLEQRELPLPSQLLPLAVQAALSSTKVRSSEVAS